MATRKRRVIAVCAGTVLALWGMSVRAEHTRQWRQSTYDEFMKGTAHGVAVRSDGRLELAPKFTNLADADASYLWTLRLDPKGALYTGGGSPAKVFRVDHDGKLTTVFESTELAAQAIAFDAKGTLYVGTSPDGKVYRVSGNGEKSVFFDPKTKYIWDLAFGADGTLYVATGDKGQIFAVAPDGRSQVFYSSDEAHIRVLAFDHRGNLIAGTEPSGRVLRLTRKQSDAKTEGKDKSAKLADGFVLYETPKREVTALTVGPDGSIYAAAIGERQHNGVQGGTTTVVSAAPSMATVTNGGNVAIIGSTSGVVQGPAPFVPFPPLLTGSIYKISPDGSPQELWSSREEVVYSLGIGADGQLLAGTGNNGALMTVDGKGTYAQLAKAGAAQITGIVKNNAGRIFLCAANPGKVIAIGPEYESEGTFESRSFDAELFSRWGRLTWWSPGASAAKGSAEGGPSRLEFFARSGNTEDPGKEWSRWFGPYTTQGEQIEAPAARFVQWKAVIHDGRSGDGIDWVSLAYQPRNVAPQIDGIAMQDPGVKAQATQVISAGQATLVNLKSPPVTTPTGITVVTQTGVTARFEIAPQGFQEKGWQSILWSAHDDNDDDLRYAVYYRAEGQTNWILLKDKIEQRYFSFDTTSLPDGAYYLKVVADDSASNPPDEALKSERESERFEVDNTPPVITSLQVSAEPQSGGATAEAKAHVAFTAKDNESAIEKAQYSVDGGGWVFVAPRTGISDSPEESYEFKVPNLKPGEHTIAVRAYDRFENVGSGKATVNVGTTKR